MIIAGLGAVLGGALLVMGMTNYYLERSGAENRVSINPLSEGNIFGVRPIAFSGALLAGFLCWFYFDVLRGEK